MSALAGKKIVNTRATHQAQSLTDLIESYGAIPIAYPCIEIRPPKNSNPLETALNDALDGKFDWVVLTSANTVNAVADLLAERDHLDALFREDLGVAVIGKKTARAAQEKLGLEIDVMPDEFIAEALVDAMLDAEDLAERRIFLPQSAIAKPTIQDLLIDAGADVVAVDAYETVLSTEGEPLINILDTIDAITFTSGSTARNFVRRFEAEGGDVMQLLDTKIIVTCIGPKAGKAAMSQALDVRVIADEHTLDGMLDALNTFFEDL